MSLGSYHPKGSNPPANHACRTAVAENRSCPVPVAIRSEPTGKRVLAVIVDEAHCASQWGGDFRPDYALLDRIRTLLPIGTPVLATSATLNSQALTDICSGLNLDLNQSFFLNLGNDRPDITPSVINMNSAKDYSAVDAFFPPPSEVHTPADLPKSMVFTNVIKKTQILCRHLRRLYPNLPRSSIDFLHAHRTSKAKRRIMKEFRKGKIKILVSTEAAGMGYDIPDIELIIQFGIPPSLPARAVMLVEKSMFQRKKPRKGGTAKVPIEPEIAGPPDSDSSSDEESDGGTSPTRKSVAKKGGKMAKADLNDGLVWGKKVDPILREYISTDGCRRDFADKHFNNPPRRPPTGPCCDNCIRMTGLESDDDSAAGSRPQTPTNTDSAPSSAHSTPSKRANANGKRPTTRGDGPATRRGEHLKDAQAALKDWRTRTFLRQYANSPFTDVGILPDKILTTLASKRIRSLDEMTEKLSVPWMLSGRHGEEVIQLLKCLDDARREQKAKASQAKKAAKQKEKEALKAAEQLKKKAAAATKPPRARGRPRRAVLPPQVRQSLAELRQGPIQIPGTPIRSPALYPMYPTPYLTPQAVPGHFSPAISSQTSFPHTYSGPYTPAGNPMPHGYLTPYPQLYTPAYLPPTPYSAHLQLRAGPAQPFNPLPYPVYPPLQPQFPSYLASPAHTPSHLHQSAARARSLSPEFPALIDLLPPAVAQQSPQLPVHNYPNPHLYYDL
ncbi:hypothetical protein C8R45DRAFT_1224523 [Mycena sanguinolenta]|nr:hypothetical protein C8R45DRAFT_1224523 [Mycena sanguinolenta]